MLLVSYEFLGFLFILTVLYYLLPVKVRWVLLLAASYVFYAMAGVKALGFVIITTVSTWFLALKIGAIGSRGSREIKETHMDREAKKAYKAKIKKRQWRWLLLGLGLNFGILCVLKYTNFTISNWNSMLHLFGSETQLGYVSWLLPLGISYYTFQSMGYLIDIYRSKYEPDKNLGHMALFVSYFPQLIQGPITRFDTMREQFFEERRFDWQNICSGMQRLLWGYFKKLVVADRLLAAILSISGDSETYRGIYVLVGMVCYTIQIYADFSGGIDIVLGASQMFGIQLPENFDRPYFSKTVPEYWRRWHMSLMLWLREYIFYPASMCKPVMRLSKSVRKRFGDGAGKRVPVYAASILVWLVVGIWHGATWGFVVWGMVNCIVLLISQELTPLRQAFHRKYTVESKRWFQVFQIARTLLLLSCIQMLEYYHTVSHTWEMFCSMVTGSRIGQLFDGRMAELGLDGKDWFVAGAGILLMLVVSLVQRRGSVREQIHALAGWKRFAVWYGLFLIVLIFGVYGQGYDASQFIYTQF